MLPTYFHNFARSLLPLNVMTTLSMKSLWYFVIKTERTAFTLHDTWPSLSDTVNALFQMLKPRGKET